VFGLTHRRHSLMGGRPEYSGLWLSSRRSRYGPVTSSLRSHFWMSGWLELVKQVPVDLAGVVVNCNPD